MTTAAVRALRKKYPDALIRYVSFQPDVLLQNPDINELSMIFLPSDRQIFFEYPEHKGYPNQPLDRHLAAEFAENAEVSINSPRGVLQFSEHELSYGRNLLKKFTKTLTATIHLHASWSVYKNWPVENWQQVVDHFFGRLTFIQIGGPKEPVLKKVVSLVGITNIRLSAACIQLTDLFVGIDSFPNHVAGALGKPAVVLFGSTSPVGSGYNSAINLWAGDDCSPCYREDNRKAVHKKPSCPHDHQCMRHIAVEEVIESIERQLSSIKKQVSG